MNRTRMYASAVRIQSHWEVPSRSRAFLPHPPTPLSAYSRFVDALRESGEGGGGLRRQGGGSPAPAPLGYPPPPRRITAAQRTGATAGGGGRGGGYGGRAVRQKETSRS